MRVYKKRGIGCHLGAKVDKVEKTKDGASVAFTTADGKQQKLEAEKVLIAIGRAPQTEDIGLDKTKIKAERGFIPTNEWMQTVEPNIYAIGDIVADPQRAMKLGENALAVVKENRGAIDRTVEMIVAALPDPRYVVASRLDPLAPTARHSS